MIVVTIQTPIRELHARAGHYVRLASQDTEAIVTESGKPAARVTPLQLAEPPAKTLGERRKLLPAFKAALFAGKLNPNPAELTTEDTESTEGE